MLIKVQEINEREKKSKGNLCRTNEIYLVAGFLEASQTLRASLYWRKGPTCVGIGPHGKNQEFTVME